MTGDYYLINLTNGDYPQITKYSTLTNLKADMESLGGESDQVFAVREVKLLFDATGNVDCTCDQPLLDWGDEHDEDCPRYIPFSFKERG